jgi:hypothetical protein
MRRILYGFLLAEFVAYIWLVIASLIYCLGTGQMRLFRFPYLQWLYAWKYTPWTPVWLVVVGMIPGLFLAMSVILLIRHRRARQSEAALFYGNSGWAGPEDMRRHGVNLRRRPF